MTITQAIMIIGILVSATVALLVSHLHRKQMRQIELFKKDPGVGLTPAPGKLAVFVASKWDLVLGFAGPLFVLFTEFTSHAPVTRLTIFSISVAITLLFTNLVMALVFKMQQRNTERIEQLLALHDRSVTSTNRVLDILEKRT